MKAALRQKKVAALTEAAVTVRRAAEQVANLEDCRDLNQLAARMEASADRLQQELEPPVKVLPLDATSSEIRVARLRQAVQVRGATYLPEINQVHFTGLPNILLRSSFFSLNDAPAMLENAVICSQDGAALTYTGPRLSQTDKQVYGAVLRYYKSQPLQSSHSDDVPWLTAYKFVTAYLGTSYNAETHKMVRDSLRRLGSADLRVRHGILDVSVPRLLSVDFADQYVEGDASSLCSSDKLRVRITEDVAPLFGPSAWTALPHYVPRVTKGLIRWLSDYYSTHSVGRFVPVARLFELSGESSKEGKPLWEFRADLKAALKRMQGAKYNVRVARFHYSKEKDAVLVVLEGW